MIVCVVYIVIHRRQRLSSGNLLFLAPLLLVLIAAVRMTGSVGAGVFHVFALSYRCHSCCGLVRDSM